MLAVSAPPVTTALCVPALRARHMPAARLARRKLYRATMDLLFVGVIVAFFALTWGLAILGDRLAIGGSASQPGALAMTGIYLLGGVVTAALLVYLCVALLKPEIF